MYPFSEVFLRLAPVPAEVQPTLVARYSSALAHNPASTDATLTSIWGSRPDLSTALAIVKRPLPAEFVCTIGARETRASVVHELALNHWHQLDDKARANVYRRATGGFAISLLDTADVATRDAMLSRVVAADALHWLSKAGPERISDDDLVAHLTRLAPKLKSGKTGAYHRRRALELLAHFRPVALPTLVAHVSEGNLSALSGVLTLDDAQLQAALVTRVLAENDLWAAMALGANPVACEATVTALKAWAAADPLGRSQLIQMLDRNLTRVPAPVTDLDAENLAILVRRARGSEYRRPRLVQLAYLLGCDQLSVHDAFDIVGRLFRQLTPPVHVAKSLEAAWSVRYDGPAPDVVQHWATEAAPWDNTIRRDELDDEPVSYGAPTTLDVPVAGVARDLEWSQRYRPLPGVLVSIADALGTDPGTWLAFCGLVDEFSGTVADVVTLARATAQ